MARLRVMVRSQVVTEPRWGSKFGAWRQARRKASWATSSARGVSPYEPAGQAVDAALEAPYEGDLQVGVAGDQASQQTFVGAGRSRRPGPEAGAPRSRRWGGRHRGSVLGPVGAGVAAGTIMVGRNAGPDSDATRAGPASAAQSWLRASCAGRGADATGGWEGCASMAPFRTPSIVTFRTIDRSRQLHKGSVN